MLQLMQSVFVVFCEEHQMMAREHAEVVPADPYMSSSQLHTTRRRASFTTDSPLQRSLHGEHR